MSHVQLASKKNPWRKELAHRTLGPKETLFVLHAQEAMTDFICFEWAPHKNETDHVTGQKSSDDMAPNNEDKNSNPLNRKILKNANKENSPFLTTCWLWAAGSFHPAWTKKLLRNMKYVERNVNFHSEFSWRKSFYEDRFTLPSFNRSD